MQTLKWMIPVLLVYLLYTFCKDVRTDLPLKKDVLGSAIRELVQTQKRNEANQGISLFAARIQGRLLLEWSMLHRPQWPADRLLSSSADRQVRSGAFSLSPIKQDLRFVAIHANSSPLLAVFWQQ